MIKSYLNKFLAKNKTRNQGGQHTKSNLNLNIPFIQQQEMNNGGVNSYNNNAIVHRCVSLIATAASHVPWQVFINNNGQQKLEQNHPALRLLKHPNIEKSGADFFIENVSNILLYGNSYMLITYNSQRNIFQLQNIHPDNLSKNENYGYNITINNQTENYEINPKTKISQILHLKNYNPANPQNGLSPLSSASQAIALHAKIMQWNKSLLNNSSKPSGALVFQDGNGYLTDEQFSRLQEQFYENFSGSSNSGKPLILEGGLKWQETSVCEKFEKFLELKDSISRDIAIAFNIPPQLLGISGDNTYSNMQEARLALWEENIIPLLDKYSDAMSTWLSHWYQQDLTIDFDKEAISVLTKRREGLWAKISDANFMTINEKRKLVGLTPLDNGNQL